MSPITEVRHVVQRELRKNLRSAKGLVLFGMSLLGGGAAALALIKVEEVKRKQFPDASPEQLRALREQAFAIVGDEELSKALSEAPLALLAVLGLTVWLAPPLVALMGFDAISSDMQHKSVRYWTLRTRRASYFVGKWLGLWATVSAVTLLMDALVWLVCIARGEGSAGVVLAWGIRLWLATLPMSAVWSAVVTLVSSLFRSPMLALLVTFASFFVLWVFWMVGQFPSFSALVYVYPNHYDRFLIHPRPDKLAVGLGACFGLAAAYLGIGSFLFSRRDV